VATGAGARARVYRLPSLEVKIRGFVLERQGTGARDRFVYLFCFRILLESFLGALCITGRGGRLCMSVCPQFSCRRF